MTMQMSGTGSGSSGAGSAKASRARGARLVVIRFTGWPVQPVEGQDKEYTALTYQVLRLMNVDRNAYTVGKIKRKRVHITWHADTGIIEYSFFYASIGWAEQALQRVDILRAYPNCTVTLEDAPRA